MRRVFLPAIALLVLLAACSGSPPTHYYAAGNGWAIYLAWTEDTTGHLQGQIQAVAADPNDPAKLKTVNGGFTGTRNGRDISISFPLISSYLGQTWTGTLKNNTISLVIPTSGLPSNPTLVAGSFHDFRKAAQEVQAQVNVAQQEQARQAAIDQQQREAAAEAAQAQFQHNQEVSAAYNQAQSAAQRVKDYYAEVRNSLAELDRYLPEKPAPGGTREQYAAKWAAERQIWGKEKAQAQVTPMTCYHKDEIIYTSNEVVYANNEIKYVDNEARSLLNNVQQAVNQANEGLDGVEQWGTAYYQNAQRYSALSGRPAGVTDPTAALSRFKKATEAQLSTFASRITGFQREISSYDKRGDDLQRKAQSFANALECSG